MDIETEKIIKKQLKYLPEDIVTFFADQKTSIQIQTIASKYKLNISQSENFQLETFLLILGLTHPDDYQYVLRDKLNISEDSLDNIINEIFVFLSNDKIEKLKVIYEKSEDDESKTAKKTIESESMLINQRFSGMPKEVQVAISSSNWKEKLYTIASKYKLTIEQMGILEETTIKVMQNEIHPDSYEAELASKITIPKEDISNLVKDVNDNILKRIRESMQNNWEGERIIENESKIITYDQLPINNAKEVIKEDEVPTPPYLTTIKNEEKVITDDQLPINNGGKEKLITNYQLIINNVTPKKLETPKPIEIKREVPKVHMNIIEEKLKSTTMSDHTVSDHSIQKITTIPSMSDDNIPKSHDPYREVF